MYPGFNQLIDIRGLDPAPWWPVAPGWWLVAALVLMVLYALPHVVRDIRRRPRQPRWHRDAARRLHDLRRRAASMDSKEATGELSELLRRIAVARYGRASCAGISGVPWLEWLQDRDPTGFDWPGKGRILLDLPYAPPGQQLPPQALRQLIDAALIWLAAGKR